MYCTMGKMLLQEEESTVCVYQVVRARQVNACAASSSSFVAIEDPSSLVSSTTTETSPISSEASTCFDRLTELVVPAWAAMACENDMCSESTPLAFCDRFLGLGLVGYDVLEVTDEGDMGLSSGSLFFLLLEDETLIPDALDVLRFL